MQEEVKKSKRGGARAGAGRKRIEGRTCPLGFSVTELAKSKLAAYAAARGLSMASAANEIFEGLEVGD